MCGVRCSGRWLRSIERRRGHANGWLVVDDFVRLTGYHRKYAMWLLKHADEGHPSPVPSPRRVYQADVEEALVLIWTKTNRLCTKRLIPSLSMFIDSLERHEHLSHAGMSNALALDECGNRRPPLAPASTARAARFVYDASRDLAQKHHSHSHV